MGSNLYYTSDFQKLSFGDKGLRIISADETSTVGENFYAIQSIVASTISCDSNAIGGDTSITSLEIGAGVVIYGNLDNIAVASGKVICYLR